MKELIIYEYQAKIIEDALRMAHNTLNCKTKETCLDRTVCQAFEIIKNCIKKDFKTQVKYI